MNHVSRLRRGASLYSLVLRQTATLQALIVAVGLLLPLLAVAPLHLQQRLIDEAIPQADFGLLAWLSGVYAAAAVARAGAKFVVIYVRGWIAEIVERVLRDEVIEAQRRRPLAEAHATLGPATSIIASEVTPLGGFAAEAINLPLIQFGTLFGVAGYMLVTEWTLGIVAVVAFGAEAVLTPYLQRKINILTRLRIESLRRAGGDLIEAADPEGRDRVRAALIEVRRVYRVCLRMIGLKASLKVARNLIDHAADVAILSIGATMVIRGQTELGVVVAFMSGVREVRGPWGELLDFYRLLADALVKHRLVNTIVGRAPSVPAQAVAAAPRRGPG